MTYSRDVPGSARQDAPPFSDGCPQCRFDGAVAPYATRREETTLVAFYRHRRCGFQWSCFWSADWHSSRRPS